MPEVNKLVGYRCENHWYCKEETELTDKQELREAGWVTEMFSHWVGLDLAYTYRHYGPTCTKTREKAGEGR